MVLDEEILLSSQYYLEQKKYWTVKLPNEINRTEFLIGNKNNNDVIFFEKTIVLEPEVTDKLKKVCKGSDETIFVYLLAVLKTLIFRYTSSNDISVLCPVNKRLTTDNTLNNYVLVYDNIDKDSTFKEILIGVRTTVIEAFTNQDFPFSRVVNEIFNQKDASAVTNTSLIYKNIHNELLLEELNSFLNFKFVGNENSIIGSIKYNSNLYSQSSINVIVNHFINILKQSLINPDEPIHKIDFLQNEEKEKILFGFNSLKYDFPADQSILSFLEKNSNLYPDKIAYKFNNEEISYSEINNSRKQFANFIRQENVRKNEVIVTLLERSIDLVISILAIWENGGIYLPLDISYPSNRILQILKDAGVKCIISKQGILPDEVIKGFTGKIIYLDQVQYSNNTSNLPFAPVYEPNGLAYIIYTSGSTGAPKGAMVEHVGMMNHIWAKINDLQIGQNDCIAQNASHTFDISIWQFFTSIVSGGRTVIYSNDDIFDPSKFLLQLNHDKVSILEVVPSYMAVLLDQVSDVSATIDNIRFLVATGEEIKPNLVSRWYKHFPQIKIVNAYGPTEASDDITHYIIPSEMKFERVPIGKPLHNFSIYIVDENMQPCPINVKGEICVSGIGVGRGYVNDQEKTDKVFLIDPFKGSGNVRLYKTGDIGRWLEDGNIEFFGRKDSQVKIRGFRIELGEIENALIAFEDIRQAVVTVIDNKLLAAYFTSDNEVNIESLKENVAKRLPEYMVPAYFTQLSEMPLTPNGKINKKALPQVNIESNIKLEIPKNNTELKLLGLWSDVLQLAPENISVTRDFFELGGHSLSAIKLLSLITKNFQVELKLKKFLQVSTIRELASEIELLPVNNISKIIPVEKQDYYELSHAQKRLWVLDQIQSSEDINHNIAEAFILEGNLNASLMKKAIDILISRHEILRTIFVEVDGELKQHVLDSFTDKGYYEYIDLRSEQIDLTQEILKTKVNEVGRLKFNLSKGPLFKVRLVQISDNEYAMVFAIHHIISDAQSLEVMVSEIASAYKSLLAGAELTLPLLDIQYKDYSAWHNKLLTDSSVSSLKNFWNENLKGELPNTVLAYDFVKQSSKDTHSRKTFYLDNETSSKLSLLIQNNDSTLFLTFLAIIKLFLFRYSKSEDKDVMVGTFANGRNNPQLENQLGFYVNTLPIRTTLGDTLTFKDMLNSIKEHFFNILDFQLYPYDKIIQDLNYTNKQLLNIIVTSIEDNAPQNRWGNLNIKYFEIDYEFRYDFDLIFGIGKFGRNFGIQIVFNENLYKAETIERLSNHVSNIIKNTVSNPSIQLGEIEYLDRSEKNRNYWDTHLSGYKENLSLPGKLTNNGGFEAKDYHFVLEARELQKLIEISRNNNISIFSLIYSSFGVLISQHNSTTDIVVCHAGIENRQGNAEPFILKIMPQRLSFKTNNNFCDVVKKIDSEINSNSINLDLKEDEAWFEKNNQILDFLYIPNNKEENLVLYKEKLLSIHSSVTLIVTISNNEKIYLDYVINSKLYDPKSITDFNNSLFEIIEKICNKSLAEVSINDLDVLSVENLEDYLDKYITSK